VIFDLFLFEIYKPFFRNLGLCQIDFCEIKVGHPFVQDKKICLRNNKHADPNFGLGLKG